MPKSTNATIGSCPCPVCGATAEVRKYKQTKKLQAEPSDNPSRWSGRLYLYCPTKCKTVKFENQEYILNNATITGDAPAETPAELPAPAGDDPLPPPPPPEPVSDYKDAPHSQTSPSAEQAAEADQESKKSTLGDWFL